MKNMLTDWITRVQNAAYAVTGITKAQIDDDLFIDDGKMKNHTGETLSKQWKKGNEKDFTIYEGKGYLRELLYCWRCYSGPSAARLISYFVDRDVWVSSHDYQGGIGMTTALMAGTFPNAHHTLTAGSESHGALAQELFSSLGLKNASVAEPGHNVGLLVAQETFEHFPEPIPRLQQVLDEYRPGLYFDASSFELTGSPGHFVHNKDIRPAFTGVLVNRGYVPTWHDTLFDEGFKKKKAREALPTLWTRTAFTASL